MSAQGQPNIETPDLVVAEGVTFAYPSLSRRFKNLRSKARKVARYEITAAVRDVSFRLKAGESLGLVGTNGSGKTTLLRLVAGIYAPDWGSIQTMGRVSTMFDSGYGLDPNATPAANVVTRGLLLGRPRSEIETAIDDIREFVDLGILWEAPLRTFSTGMSSRIIVGLATAFDTDILLMDEAIGAADIGFQERAALRFEQLMSSTGTMIMATHNRDLMERFCARAVLMSHGVVVHEGEVGEVWSRHEAETRRV